jgi:hypothetical protein
VNSEKGDELHFHMAVLLMKAHIHQFPDLGTIARRKHTLTKKPNDESNHETSALGVAELLIEQVNF